MRLLAWIPGATQAYSVRIRRWYSAKRDWAAPGMARSIAQGIPRDAAAYGSGVVVRSMPLLASGGDLPELHIDRFAHLAPLTEALTLGALLLHIFPDVFYVGLQFQEAGEELFDETGAIE